MEKTKKQRKLKAMVAGLAACLLVAGSATAAYAMDLGGIQRTLALWIHGDKTGVTIEFDGDGNYNLEYADEEGNVVRQGGGGVSFAPDGTEIPASEEDLIEQLSAPTVEYEDDGSIWVYWFDQKVEITDQFENDVCYVRLVNGEEILYMTVKYQNGYATSPNEYPASFN